MFNHPIALHPLVQQASNIKREANPAYSTEDFLHFYPQFRSVVPGFVLDSLTEMARECLQQRRYGTTWAYAMGLFIAHFATLYLQSKRDAGSPAAEVMAAASAAGVVTSESADGLSYSLDTSALQDLQGWGAFKLTTFGVQFASIAKLHGKGGMFVL